MKVTQPDSRSIRILSDTGLRISVPYRLFWNGHERPAESIALEEGPKGSREVRAFFLFGEIRDRITEDRAGITVARTWRITTAGSVHLDLDLEMEPTSQVSCLFPGVDSAGGLPPVPCAFLAERTAWPAGLLVASGRKAFLVFSPSAESDGEKGSIGISRTEAEDEPHRLRIRLRFPGVEAPTRRVGPKPQDVMPAEEALIESSGSLERSHELCLCFSSREEIVLRGAASVLGRLKPRHEGDPGRGEAGDHAHDARRERGQLQRVLSGLLDRHLYAQAGVAGLRETADSPWISAEACVACALALHRGFPRDRRRLEQGLRLADFALKGQVPWGSFYESYHLPSRQWRGVRGRSDRLLLSVGQSARIAELLLELSEELAASEAPYEKYFLAGLRFVDFFLDDRGRLIQPGGLQSPGAATVQDDPRPGLPGMELFFPMARILARTGKDRYRKGLEALVRRFSALAWEPFDPPASREGRSSDSAGALLAVRLYLGMRAAGFHPAEAPVTGAAASRAKAAEAVRRFASLLVPWIRLQAASPPAGLNPPPPDAAFGRGCLLDSFARNRLLYAGNETALLLLRLSAVSPDAEDRAVLELLARECLASGRGLPFGTGFVLHTDWDDAGRGASGSTRRALGMPRRSPRAGSREARRGTATAVGPVDSRRAAREVLAALELAREFPRLR